MKSKNLAHYFKNYIQLKQYLFGLFSTIFLKNLSFQILKFKYKITFNILLNL